MPDNLSLASLGVNPNLAGRVPGKSYNTQLGTLGEMAFRQWVAQNHVPFNPDATTPQDYDMRGFYQGLQQGNPKARTGIDENDGKVHFTDFWKTPIHETFSNQSQWAPADAPAWNNLDQLVAKDGSIVFDDRANRPVQAFNEILNKRQPQTLADLAMMPR